MRRIALGYAGRRDLSPNHLRHLERLGLVIEIEGSLALTPEGRLRYETLARPLGLMGDAVPDELERLLGLLVARPRQ